MNDLTSRQAVIDMFQRLADDIWNQSALTTWSNAFSECAEMIRNLPYVEPEQQWISVKERLPEYGQAVLVALDGGSMTDGVRSADHAGRSVWDCALDNRTWYGDENIVIAWMPLPEEPYKEKK